MSVAPPTDPTTIAEGMLAKEAGTPRVPMHSEPTDHDAKSEDRKAPTRGRASFASIPDHWVPIAYARDLKTGRPLGLVVDDVPVVLWRLATGISALVDQCPHRSVKLSGSKLVDGAIECPFHAWRFGGDGVCRAIPLVEDAVRPAKVRAGRLAAREEGGMLWLYTRVLDPDEDAPATPALPVSMTQEGWSGDAIVREWDAHWSRAIQTMLDVAHIPFVHARTIGAGLGRKIGKVSEAGLNLDLRRREDGGYDMDWGLTDPKTGAQSDQGWLAFLPPNGMSLRVPVNGTVRGGAPKEWYLHIWCTPTTAGRSNQFVVPRRNFGRGNPVWKAADKLNIVVLNEDKRNVETAWPSRVPRPRDEVSMPTDASTIAFQHYHYNTFVRPADAALEAAE